MENIRDEIIEIEDACHDATYK
jgi:hypothetical protein